MNNELEQLLTNTFQLTAWIRAFYYSYICVAANAFIIQIELQ